MSKYTYNVGEVVVREDECFWIFPSGYMKNEEYTICSPWFSSMGEKWRLVKEPYSEVTENKGTTYCWTHSDLIFRLWKRVCSSLPEYKYTIQLSLKTADGEELIKRVGDVHSDYGCQLTFPDLKNTIFSENGLLKLFFDIQREDCDNIAVEVSNEGARVEDETNSEDVDNIKNEGSSEDGMSSEDENGDKKKNIPPRGVQSLIKDLKEVFQRGQMTDAVLKVENHAIHVHKAILVARSPVFAPMFKHDLEEKKTNVVDLPDCSVESIEVFLNYLYTGSAKTIKANNVCNLYRTAHEFLVNDLKEKCVRFMKRNISIEIFCDVIALSLLYEEDELKEKAIRFFCKNIKMIIKTVQWQEYMAEKPTEANELLIKALKA